MSYIYCYKEEGLIRYISISALMVELHLHRVLAVLADSLHGRHGGWPERALLPLCFDHLLLCFYLLLHGQHVEVVVARKIEGHQADI